MSKQTKLIEILRSGPMVFANKSTIMLFVLTLFNTVSCHSNSILHGWAFFILTADTSTDYFTQCSPTFTKQGTNMTVQFESANQDGSDLVTCQSLCQADADCLSFHFNATGGQCRLSSSDLSSASGACADCQFFTKDCLPGLCLPFVFLYQFVLTQT